MDITTPYENLLKEGGKVLGPYYANDPNRATKEYVDMRLRELGLTPTEVEAYMRERKNETGNP